MANFVKAISEQTKGNWLELWRRFMGKEWDPGNEDDRGIEVEPQLESLEEIDRFMRQKPSGRMGRG